jgi:hypothetical protein
MSELGYVSYEEAPSPLTDTERRLLKRMFSDYFEVPSEWKSALKADLERDPPILGKATLGSGVQESKIPLESMASSGMIGQSGVTIFGDGIQLGTEQIKAWGAGGLSISSNWLYFGPTQNIRIGRDTGSASGFQISADILYFGAYNDNALVRESAEQWATYQRFALRKTAAGNTTPLILNCGGVDQGVLVGPNNSAGGVGRALYVPNA